MFMQDEEGGQACEDGFQSQEDGGVGGGEMLLGPALDGEGGGGGEEAGYGQGDEEAGGDGEVGFSAKGQGDRHDESGYADLEGGELAGGDSVGGVGEGEEVAGEGDRAGEGEEVSGADADEEVLQGGSGGVVRRRRPEKARIAPMAVVQRGGGVLAERSAGMIVRRGTKTTTRPVMKADLAGVVRARPAVWN